MGQTYHVGTFGCQMNARDSERIAGMLEQMGYAPAKGEDDANVVVYNTCCVRGHAESRVYGRLGYLKHLKAQNKNTRIVLCGCMAQRADVVEKIKAEHPYVDVVVGTFNLRKLPELLQSAIETGSQIIDVWQTHDDWDEPQPEARKYKNKAGVNIMYGCDNYCSYCIVPYVRGRERSRKPSEILREVSALLDDGVREITLLGQNVNSYGRGLADPIDFAALLRQVAQTGVPKIKFLTSHPKDVSDRLIAAMAELDSVSDYIHLPVQSGSTEILRRMNRQYTREDYFRLVEKIRTAMPEASVTTDLIVGFPGETEDDFAQTLDMARTVRWRGAFTFIYSKRPGTPAADLDGQLPHKVMTERFRRLLDVVNPIVYEINQSKVGKSLLALPETDAPDPQTGLYRARAEDNTPIHFSGGGGLDWLPITITEGKPFYLMGEA